MTRYPTHDAVNTQLERVFNKEMENFDMDYDLEQDDERCFWGAVLAGIGLLCRLCVEPAPTCQISLAERSKVGETLGH